MSVPKMHIKRTVSVLLAVMMIATSIQFSFGLVGSSAQYDFETILAQSNFPVINISIENGEAPDKVNKENKKNATFEIKNTNGKGKDLTITTETSVTNGVETVVWPMTIKGRGNSSWTMATEKKPYNIKFNKKQDLLGMGKQKSYSLIANWVDTTFIRNYMAYKMGATMNTNAMDCELVELCINGKYEGLYLLTEKYGIGDTRIITGGDGRDLNGDGEVTQFLIEADSRAVDNNEPNRFQTDSETWFVIKEPDEDEITSASDFRYNHAAELVQKADDAILNGGNYQDYIDIDSFIDVYIIQEFTKNPDFGYGYQPCYASTFINAEEGGKLYFGTIWDFDIAMGRNDYADQATEGNRDTLSPTGYLHKNTKWVSELFEDPDFVQKVRERWTEVSTQLKSMLDTLLPQTIELVRPSAALDFATWGGASGRTTNWNYRQPLDFDGETQYVTAFLNERYQWLNDEWGLDEIIRSYDAQWTRSETGSSVDKTAVYDSEEDVWDGGFGYVETDTTINKVYGKPQSDLGGNVELDAAYTLSGPSGNTNSWWLDDGTAAGGFGGWANTLTASKAGRYVYATDTKGWWFQEGSTYTMGVNGVQIYIVDIDANGAVTLHDGEVSSTKETRTVTVKDTNYGYITVSGNSITVSYKSDQTGNTGVVYNQSSSSKFELSMDESFTGTLNKVNRPSNSIYSDIPVSVESAYIYCYGANSVSWSVKDKTTREDANGSIVAFDESTRKVTALGTGTVVITATANNGETSSVEIQSAVTTATEIPMGYDSRFGKYYTARNTLAGAASEKGQWATFTGGVTTYIASVNIDAEDYNRAKSFSLATKNRDEIIGGEGTYYVYVNGAPLFKATDGTDQLALAGFSDENTVLITKDNDEFSSASQYSYMNGKHAHTTDVMSSLKSFLNPGENIIEIIAYSENGSALSRPYLFSTNTVGEIVDIPVTGIKFTASVDEMNVGETARFAASVIPDNATNGTIEWNSSDESILTVDLNGNVKAISAGSADIIASSNGFTVSKTVNVLPVKATSITVDPAEVTLKIGDTKKVTVTVLPENAEDKTYYVESNTDSSVADFDVSTNVITAKNAGVTAITIKSGNATAAINVTVESAGEDIHYAAFKINTEKFYHSFFGISYADTETIIVNNKAYVPMRQGSQVLYASVEYVVDGDKEIITADFTDYKVEMFIGGTEANIYLPDGSLFDTSEIPADQTPIIVNNKTYLPARVMGTFASLSGKYSVNYVDADFGGFVIYAYSNSVTQAQLMTMAQTANEFIMG